MRFLVSFVAVLLLACTLACGGRGLEVTGIQLGRSINTDGTVANHTTRFDPTDHIYVSIQTSGVGSATLGVKWIYAGRVLGEPTKQVSYRDVAATEFHLQSADGFPPGDYKVEAFLDGKPIGTREFKVERP
jgi:hypothetical protein